MVEVVLTFGNQNAIVFINLFIQHNKTLMKKVLLFIAILLVSNFLKAQELRKVYHENGQLSAIGKWENYNPVGEWKYYHENGQLSAIGQFIKGKLSGRWKFYDENGNIKKRGSYTDEKKHGLWNFFRQNEPKKIVLFDNGKENGEVNTIVKDGKVQIIPIGYWTYYHENGNIESAGAYNDDSKKTGEWKYYDEIGKPTKIETYINGVLKNSRETNQEGASTELTIGNQVWTSENLNVNKFRNGDVIPHAKTKEEWKKAAENKQPAWCNYDNDPANGEKYGKLYNWYAVNDTRGLAPSGWHIPSDEEWTELTDYLGGESVAGGKLKETGTTHWLSPNTGATNETGFTALPGGYRFNNGPFDDIGSDGNWWSATEDDASNAWIRYLYDDYSAVDRSSSNKGLGFSVRCVRD